ncbi:hypothetical protein BKA57DRAFT_453650 [Linnemannia elongata]|nr:hypothetical protein BKA57DRAFT_453650 [Linnemannia elongata]
MALLRLFVVLVTPIHPNHANMGKKGVRKERGLQDKEEKVKKGLLTDGQKGATRGLWRVDPDQSQVIITALYFKEPERSRKMANDCCWMMHASTTSVVL